jgi:tripartite-type tricarboxylate transporter receptor subunit TctC
MTNKEGGTCVKRKGKILFGLGILILMTIAPLPVLADYPEKPIQLIVPWATGGLTDTAARALSSVISGKYLPVSIAVINRPGAGGSVGQTEMVRSKPDGYTLAMNTGSCLFIEPHLKSLPYSPDDYITVLQVFSEESVIAAHPSKPYNNLKELIEYAKANPKQVNAGIHAPLTTGHLAFLQMELEKKIEFKIVPMGGGGPMKTALLGGHVDIAPLSISEALPYIKAKTVKALGVMGPNPIEGFPEIVPFEKQGFAMEAPIVGFLMTPRGVSEDVIIKLHDAFKKAMDDPAFLKVAQTNNMQIVYLNSQDARARLNRFYRHYGELIKRLGLDKK